MARKGQNSVQVRKAFHLEFRNVAQKMAWTGFEQHHVLFLLGPAGTGKTHLAAAFAISQLLDKRCKRIVMTRPIVEAGGENLGFLPGDPNMKVHPYMLPLYDEIGKLVGWEGPDRERVDRVLEIAPLAYMRGRTFDDAVCILDEAQNCTYGQIKLFLTRFGENSKIIVTGDPQQSDRPPPVAILEAVEELKSEQGIGVVEFSNDHIVRHPLVARILAKMH